jgi:hypothetical protein
VSVYPVLTRLLVLAGIRAAAGAVFLAAAVAAGAEAWPAFLAFALGAGGSAVLLVSDRRSRFRAPPVVEPLPAGMPRASWWRAVAGGLWPSTLGVAVFAVIALAADATLAALLTGILAGMALASLFSVVRIAASERREGAHYYGELGGRRVFRGPR